MRIAIWGFGPYGQQMYYRIMFGGGQRLSVTGVFDRSPERLDLSRMPEETIVLPSSELPALYKEGRFEAVLIGIYLRQVRAEVESFLKNEGIPVLQESEMEKMLEADPLFGKEKRDVRQALEQIAATCGYRDILDGLKDRESKDLFLAKIFTDLSGEESVLLDTMKMYRGDRVYDLYELHEPMAEAGADRVILFGGGADGRVNRTALSLCGIPVAACCVRDPARFGELWPDVPMEACIVPAQLNDSAYGDCLVIVSSQEERDQIRECLREISFPSDRVYDPPGTRRALLTGTREGQYFDVWKPRKDEVFVDCGAYNGQTILDFTAWTRGRYAAIHSLEPLPDMQAQILELKEKRKIHDLRFYPYAAWDREETLRFILENDLTSSNVSTWGYEGERTISVQGMPLDAVISGPVTFIKMDIEGSEMKALDGAEQLIRKYRPRLALSVYHRVLDVVFLARRVLEMVPEYRLKVRHYGAGLFETVLYASVDDWE